MLQAYPSGPAEDPAWDAFVAAHPRGQFLQSAEWGRFRERWGWRTERVVVREGDAIVAGAQLLVRGTPLGDLAYVPRGPVCEVGDPAWPALHASVLALTRRAVAVRWEPHWADGATARRWLEAQGFTPAPPVQPPSTIVIDLRAPEDFLLAGMKQKWRYNVRLAERRGVIVREGDESCLAAFGQLMRETALRDRFGARVGDYYADAWRRLRGAARLYIAELGERTLAAVMVIHFGAVATYLYGASSDWGRENMPNHLLQWEAMRRARADGRQRYDLWGIPDAIGKAVARGVAAEDAAPGTGGLWGVWGFKRGFGGEIWRSVGAWDEVRAPFRYWLGARLLPRLRGRAGGEP